MSTGEEYVAAAYLVVFVVVLAYVAIIALKLSRLERALGELEALAMAPVETEEPTRLPVAGGDSAEEASPPAA